MMDEQISLGGAPVVGFALGDGPEQPNRVPRALKYGAVGAAGVGAAAAGLSYVATGEVRSRRVLLAALLEAVGGGALGWASF